MECGQSLVAGGRLGEEPRASDGQQRLRGHGEGHVPVPAHPAAHLVLIQAHLALALREALLDGPSAPGDAGHLLQARVGGSKDEVSGDLLSFGTRTAQQQKALPLFAVRMVDPQRRPVKDALPFGACAHADLRPSVGGHLGLDGFDAPLAKAHPDTLLAGDGQHVGLPGLFQSGVERSL